MTIRVNGVDANATTLAEIRSDLSVPTLAEIYASGRVYNVRQYGAVGDGVADDAPAINTANTAAAATGGIVYYPSGVYRVARFGTTTDEGTQHFAIRVSNTVYHVGAGVGATTVFLANSADSHVFYSNNPTDCGVLNMTINGNRANQAVQNPSTGNDPAGVFCLGQSTRTLHRDLRVINTPDFGIGFQGAASWQQYCTVENVLFENTGADSIDAKNGGNNSFGNKITNCTSASMTPSAGQATQQAAFNTRAGWTLDGINVRGLTGDTVGIRLQGDEAASGGGEGAFRSTLTNFNVRASSAGTTIGLMCDGRGNVISQGTVQGTNIGVQVRQRENSIGNLFIETTATAGVLLADSGFLTNGERTTLTNVTVRAGGTAAFDIRSDFNRLVNCVARSSGTGFAITSTASNTSIIGGEATANTVAQVSDAGAATVIQDVFGIRTENRVSSSGFAVDSTGTRTVVMAHGLAFTPTAADCQITVFGGTNDFRADSVRVTAVDATNVTAAVVVGAASATPGATANLALFVKVRA